MSKCFNPKLASPKLSGNLWPRYLTNKLILMLETHQESRSFVVKRTGCSVIKIFYEKLKTIKDTN